MTEENNPDIYVEYSAETFPPSNWENLKTYAVSFNVKNVQLPTVLKFRKTLPHIDVPNAIAINENAFQVETFDVETTRKTVKAKYPEFEEVR